MPRITKSQFELAQSMINALVDQCDEMIAVLEKEDTHSAQRAMSSWVDRRASLINAHEMT